MLFPHSINRQTEVSVSYRLCDPKRLGAPQCRSEIWKPLPASPLFSAEEISTDRAICQQSDKSLSHDLYYLQLWVDWQTSFWLIFLFFQGIVKRDEIVFRAARRRGIPILMVTSGGYQKKTARIIADSILNLHQQGLIGAEVLEGEGSSSLVTNMMCSPGSVGSKFTAVWDTFILTGVSQTAVILKGTQVTLYYMTAVMILFLLSEGKCVHWNLMKVAQCLFAHIWQQKDLRNMFTFCMLRMAVTQRE